MRRLAATLLCDLRLQLRNGFYYASGLVVVVSVVLLYWLPDDAVAWLLPVVILENVLVNTYYFIAGLMLLEKSEGTMEAQLVTPLRSGEYLASKVITLTALSLVESLLITIFARGTGGGLLLLAVGITLASVFLCLAGVVIVARYDSINEYLMPSVVYSALLSLPLLGYFGVGSPVLYLWHPIQSALDLMRSGVEPLGGARLTFALVYPALWLLPLAWWSRHARRVELLG